MIARQRIFQVHASGWFAVNTMLFVIWLLAGGGHPWFLYPLIGWGAGLAVHATIAFTGPFQDAELDSGGEPRRLGR